MRTKKQDGHWIKELKDFKCNLGVESKKVISEKKFQIRKLLERIMKSRRTNKKQKWNKNWRELAQIPSSTKIIENKELLLCVCGIVVHSFRKWSKSRTQNNSEIKKLSDQKESHHSLVIKDLDKR